MCGDVCGEADPVGDIAAVEALAFQQLEPALDDTVGVRGTVAGAHVREMGPGCERVVAIDVTAGPQGLFGDVNAVEWSTVEGLYEAGVTKGCSTTPLLYCPDEPVTRAQMASFIIRALP